MMEIKYSRYQIDNIHGSLYVFLVDKSVDANNHCFLNNNVNSYSIKARGWRDGDAEHRVGGGGSGRTPKKKL